MIDAITVIVCGASGVICYGGSLMASDEDDHLWNYGLWLLAMGNVYLCLMAGARITGFIA